MKLKLTILAAALAAISAPAAAAQSVNGYITRDGTYVAPHFRTAPDSSRYNNYSSQGNVNPYNGNRGYVNPNPAPSYGNNYSSPYSYGYRSR